MKDFKLQGNYQKSIQLKFTKDKYTKNYIVHS